MLLITGNLKTHLFKIIIIIVHESFVVMKNN